MKREAAAKRGIHFVGASGPVVLACVLLALAMLQFAEPAAHAQDRPAQAPPSSHAEHHMISLVVLSKTYVDLDVDTLSKQLDELYPGKFQPLNQQANFVVKGPTLGQFLIKSTIPGRAGIFMLLSVPAPYTEFSNFMSNIGDPDLRRKAKAQDRWIAVDLVREIATEDEAYQFIAAAVAKLAPADAAVLVDPGRNTTIPFDDNVRRDLASGHLPPH
jgi:hypothetical protein